jgi:tRNA A-37 threonylcarbamoyl transferase component Bud32
MILRRHTMAHGSLGTAERIGRYEILRRLGEGGMAEIYLARVVGLEGFEKLVVVKRLPSWALENRELVDMFLHEARLAALLQHQNVVQVFDVGIVEDSYFFSMEFVHGQDASRILRAARQQERTIPLDVALTVVRDVAAGLHYAHEKPDAGGHPLGIIHRDVSPSNVLVSYDGMVKLADFGIAKARSRDHETRHGTLKGKIAYMSPEQCRAQPLDRRSDLFSLGVVLWELTTGQRLFTGPSDFDILERIVHQPAPPPSSVRADYPPALEALVRRALERDRAARPATAEQIQLELEAFALGAGMTLSTVRVARFMGQLFQDEITAWQSAQARNLGLAEHLTATWDLAVGQAPTRLLAPGAPETRALTPPPRRPGGAAPAATVAITPASATVREPGPPPVAAARRMRWVVAALAGGLLAAVLGLAWLALRPARPATPVVIVPAAPAPVDAGPVAASQPAAAPIPAPVVAGAPGREPALDAGTTPRRRGGAVAVKKARPRPRPAAKRDPARAWDPNSPVPP